MKFDVASITHVGNVRQNNQDRVLALQGIEEQNPEILLAVADGMGGLACGEKASGIAMEVLEKWWQTMPAQQSMQQISQSLDAAIYEAHREIYYFAESMQKRTGSTLSLLYIQGGNYVIKQIGDSRVYRFGQHETCQLTTDQTWCNQQIQAGEMTPEQARNHRLKHALVNALGASSELEISTLYGTLHTAETYLLCSDGFYSEADLRQLQQCCIGWPADQALTVVMRQILSGSAEDNASAVLCRVFH